MLTKLFTLVGLACSAAVAGALFSLSWTAIAFAGVNVWTSIGPEGATVFALAVDPSNSRTVYAGTFGNGVFKSTDSGVTWSPANTGLSNTKVTALAIDPVTPTTLYAGVTNLDVGLNQVAQEHGRWRELEQHRFQHERRQRLLRLACRARW